MNKYFILYKPYGYLSQFTKEMPEHLTLADLGKKFPKDAYPVGRLDKDSEGLLIITNDKKLNHELQSPQHQHTYFVQVEGVPTKDALQQLRKGVEIKMEGKSFKTPPAQMVRLLSEAPAIPDRNPPIRFRKEIPDSWLEIELKEGKKQQIRKMCAKVGFPVLRLIRTKIEKLEMRDLESGKVLEMEGPVLYKLLKLNS